MNNSAPLSNEEIEAFKASTRVPAEHMMGRGIQDQRLLGMESALELRRELSLILECLEELEPGKLVNDYDGLTDELAGRALRKLDGESESEKKLKGQTDLAESVRKATKLLIRFGEAINAVQLPDRPFRASDIWNLRPAFI